MLKRAVIIILALAAGLAPAMANAQWQSSRAYRVEAHADYWVDLTLCSPNVELDIQGDGDTDVDFTVYDTSNTVVFSDVALNDRARTTLHPPSRGGACLTWRLKMTNLGNVWNSVTVNMSNVGAPANGGGGKPGAPAAPTYAADRTYRVEPHQVFWVDLNLCSPQVTVTANGDGDTDVDFTVYDAANNVMFNDVGLTDRTVAVLHPPAGKGGCVLWKLKLNNLGDVWNGVTVSVR